MKLTKTDFWAAIAGIIALMGWYYWNEQLKDREPAENWLVVRNIFIPNFVENENPVIVYDREHRREATIRRNVDIHHAANLDGDPVCSGRIVKSVAPGEGGDVNMLFTDFLNSNCTLKEGIYVAQTSWVISAKGYPAKRLTYTSNVFRIYPEGTIPFTEKEQEQLEKAQELLNNPLIEGIPQ